MCLVYCACHAKSIFADPLRMSHACQRFWNCCKIFTFCSLLARCRIPCTCRTKTTLQRPKMVWAPGAFTCLTSQCASRHNGVHFSTSELPKVLRAWHVLAFWLPNLLGHSGVQLFISHLPKWLRTRRFSEPTFWDFSSLQSHETLEKHSLSRLFYLFAHLDLVSSDSFSSLIFFLLLYSSLL